MQFKSLKDFILQSKWRLYIPSIGYTLVLAPQLSLFSLQTSIGVKDGLGASSIIVFGVLGFVTLLAYGPLMTLIGRKNCLVYGEIPSVLYTLSYFYPRFWTVTTAGILIGIADSIITSAFGVILMSLAPNSDESIDYVERKNSRMGIFLAIRGLGQAISSIVPGLILKDSIITNITVDPKSQLTDISNCGANDCPSKYAFLQSSSMFGRLIPSNSSLHVYLGIICAAQIVGIITLVVAIPSDGKLLSEEEYSLLSSDARQDAKRNLKSSFFRVMHHMTEKYRLLTIPTHLQHGFFMSFLWSEIGRAYVSCAIGVGQLGFFTSILFTSLFFANLIWNKFGTSRSLPALYLLTFVLEMTVYLVSLFWRLSNSQIHLKLYLFAVLLGITHSFRKISSYSVTINYFKDLESAYLIQVGGRGLGNAIVFTLTTALCVFVKIYIFMTFSVLSTVLVLIAHFQYSAK